LFRGPRVHHCALDACKKLILTLRLETKHSPAYTLTGANEATSGDDAPAQDVLADSVYEGEDDKEDVDSLQSADASVSSEPSEGELLFSKMHSTRTGLRSVFPCKESTNEYHALPEAEWADWERLGTEEEEAARSKMTDQEPATALTNWGLVAEPLPEDLRRRFLAKSKMQNKNKIIAKFSIQDVSQVVQVDTHCQIDGDTYVHLRIPLTKGRGSVTYMYHRCPIKSCVKPIQCGLPYDVVDDARLKFYRFAGRPQLVKHIKEAHGLSTKTFNNTHYHVSKKKMSAAAFEKNIRERLEKPLAQVRKKARMDDRGDDDDDDDDGASDSDFEDEEDDDK
jgi:hypothetical protein